MPRHGVGWASRDGSLIQYANGCPNGRLNIASDPWVAIGDPEAFTWPSPGHELFETFQRARILRYDRHDDGRCLFGGTVGLAHSVGVDNRLREAYRLGLLGNLDEWDGIPSLREIEDVSRSLGEARRLVSMLGIAAPEPPPPPPCGDGFLAPSCGGLVEVPPEWRPGGRINAKVIFQGVGTNSAWTWHARSQALQAPTLVVYHENPRAWRGMLGIPDRASALGPDAWPTDPSGQPQEPDPGDPPPPPPQQPDPNPVVHLRYLDERMLGLVRIVQGRLAGQEEVIATLEKRISTLEVGSAPAPPSPPSDPGPTPEPKPTPPGPPMQLILDQPRLVFRRGKEVFLKATPASHVDVVALPVGSYRDLAVNFDVEIPATGWASVQHAAGTPDKACVCYIAAGEGPMGRPAELLAFLQLVRPGRQAFCRFGFGSGFQTKSRVEGSLEMTDHGRWSVEIIVSARGDGLLEISSSKVGSTDARRLIGIPNRDRFPDVFSANPIHIVFGEWAGAHDNQAEGAPLGWSWYDLQVRVGR
jgi:hypothetical protein